MVNAGVQEDGMGLNVTCPVQLVLLGPVAPMNATAIMMPPATLWTGGASASQASLEHDAKSFALKVTGERTAIEPANAKMPTLSAILFRDAFADQDLQVK